jgi:hypothetical protein
MLQQIVARFKSFFAFSTLKFSIGGMTLLMFFQMVV